MAIKCLGLMYIFLFSTGCASLAHSPYACDDISTKLAFSGFNYVLVGNLFQIGDCAISKTLKVELGDYYRHNKDKIDFEVRNSLTPLEGHEVEHFARAFNCPKDSFVNFHILLVKNKNEIFGEKFDHSPRQVTKTIQKLIDVDASLAMSCR